VKISSVPNFHFQRYTVCMYIYRYFIPVVFFMCCAVPTLSLAGDSVMPPDVQVAGQASAEASADESLGESLGESLDDVAPNLHDELQPDDTAGVDVRSFKRRDGTIIREYSVNGQVFQIKVQPPGGLPAYYLDRDADGQFERRLTRNSTRVTPPSWILKEF